MMLATPLTRSYLLSAGFALASSFYATTGWAIEQAVPDQIAVLDKLASLVGEPTRTIAWGHSLGGIITVGLALRFPDRFSAALPLCGVLAGGVGTWNLTLDVEVAFEVLLAQGTGLQLVNIANPGANLGILKLLSPAAKTSPHGEPASPLLRLSPTSQTGLIPLCRNQASRTLLREKPTSFFGRSKVDFPFAFAFRSELELRKGIHLGTPW
jgi:pimeloyl-ACP methyl ester carboxylesterase